MSSPLMVTFGDVVTETIAVLSARLADREEPYAHRVRFGTEKPETDEALPVVQVACDLDMVTYPIVSRATVRLTVWHTRNDYANDLAQLSQAMLLTHTGDVLAGFSSLTGPLRGTDPETGTCYASITVRASMRGTAL